MIAFFWPILAIGWLAQDVRPNGNDTLQQLPMQAEAPGRLGEVGLRVPCGAYAITTLGHLWGRPTAVADVLWALDQGDSTKSSHSMAELKDAAGSLGLTLKAEEIIPADWPIDRPGIICLRDDTPVGHFVVVRPVGPTGTLAQIIDPSEGVTIADAEFLLSSGVQDRVILCPVSVAEANRWWIVVSTFLVAGLVAFGLSRRRRTNPTPQAA